MKIIPLCLTLSGACAFFTSEVQSQTPRSYQANFTRDTPTIDGVVDADEWSAAESAAGDWELLRTDPPEPDTQNSRFRMLWDDQFLYILYETDYGGWTAGNSDSPVAFEVTPPQTSPINTGIDFGGGVDILNLYFDPNTDDEDDQTRPQPEQDGYQLAFEQRTGESSLFDGSYQNTQFYLEAHVNTPNGNNGRWRGLRETVMAQNNGASSGVIELAIAWEDLDALLEEDFTDEPALRPEDLSLHHPFAPENEDRWVFNLCRQTTSPANFLPLWNWHPGDPFAISPHGEVLFVGRMNDAIRFGTVGNHETVQASVTIENASETAMATISAITASEGDTDRFTIVSFPETLEPLATGQIIVEFDPTDTVGSIEAIFDIESDAVDDNVVPRLYVFADVFNTSGLIAHYQMDETEGTTAVDSSGYGRDGEYGAGASGSFALGESPLASGTAVRLSDGGGAGAGFMRIPGESLPLLYNYTLSLWVEVDAADIGTNSYLFAKGSGADPFAFLTQPAEEPYEGLFGIGGDTGFATDPVLQVGTTQHLVLVFQDENGGDLGATRADFYVNGVLGGSISEDLAGYVDFLDAALVIGANEAVEGVTGLVDDVQIYDRALVVSEVVALFENPGEPLPNMTNTVEQFGIGVRPFTGGDPGEGADFEGDFVYAINMLGPGDLAVGDAMFTTDAVEGFTFNLPEIVLEWHAAAYGETTNDDNLETVVRSIRYSTAPATMTLGGLEPGMTYQLQLLLAENCCNRGWNITFDGERGLPNFNVQRYQGGIANTNQGVVVSYAFIPVATEVVIDFTQGTPFPDNNAILNGLTLEQILDTDGDGLDDEVETSVFGDLLQNAHGDIDGDGLINGDELYFGTDPMVADTDEDGLNDAEELSYGTLPLVADSDRDGVSDGDEVLVYDTNPSAIDTDGDGASDGDEVLTYGTDPLQRDSDGDGYADGREIEVGTDPNDDNDFPDFRVAVRAFTGGDRGENLDLDGDFLYAINMRGPAVVARDASFTLDDVEGFTYDQPNEIAAWGAPAYGDTPDDDAIEAVMGSIRWSAAPANMTLANLIPGERYKLQLLLAESGSNRGWDIYIEGRNVLNDFNISEIQGGVSNNAQGVVISYLYTASEDTLNIGFVNDDPTSPDNNPILNGLTLEHLSPLGNEIVLDFEEDPIDVLDIYSNSPTTEWRLTSGVEDSGYLSLTDAVGSVQASVVFTDLSGGASIQAFRFSVDARIGGGSPTPADGFSINLVRPEDPLLAPPVGSGYVGNGHEEGSQTGLSIGFDAYLNGEADVIGFTVRSEGELLTEVPAATLNGALEDVTSLQTGPATGNIADLGWAKFEVILEEDGTLDVIWKGSTVVDNLQTDWTPSRGRLVFGARTGGANQAHHFDNLSLSVTPAAVVLADVTQPGDPILLVDGVNDGDANEGPPPAAEGVEHVIDDVAAKFLHFLDLGSGFIVTPNVGGTVVNGLRIYTANDAPERDPASYELMGSTVGPEGPFVLISEGELALPEDRNDAGLAVTPALFHQEVSFDNTEAYRSYRLIFPTLKDAETANSMQIAEVEFLGEVVGIPGLLAYWNFDDGEGDIVMDITGNGNDGQINAETTGQWVDDQERGAVIDLEGTAVDFGTILPVMTLENEFTWAFWAKSGDTGTNNIVFGNRYNPEGGEFAPREFIKFTSTAFEWHVNALPENLDYEDFPLDVWVHHVVTKSGATLTYYRNGVEAGSSTITSAPINAQPFYIGGQGALESWPGLMDEAALFTRALSASEVGTAYQWGTEGRNLFGLAPTVTPPIRDPGLIITDMIRSDSGIAFSYATEDGVLYDVEFSTDLVEWNAIATDVTGVPEGIEFVDEDIERVNAAEGYYRVRKK